MAAPAPRPGRRAVRSHRTGPDNLPHLEPPALSAWSVWLSQLSVGRQTGIGDAGSRGSATQPQPATVAAVETRRSESRKRSRDWSEWEQWGCGDRLRARGLVTEQGCEGPRRSPRACNSVVSPAYPVGLPTLPARAMYQPSRDARPDIRARSRRSLGVPGVDPQVPPFTERAQLRSRSRERLGC